MKYKICNLKGFEKLYYIYENGDIYSTRKRRLLKAYLNSDNLYSQYLYVCLTGHNGEQLRTGVHRLVAHHFINPEPVHNPLLGRYEVNHKDRDKGNNHYSNLEWVTHANNRKLV